MAGDKRAADAGVTADEQLEAAPVELTGLEAGADEPAGEVRWSIWKLRWAEASARPLG